MQVTFVRTSNEKFANAYALEKAIESMDRCCSIYLYDRIEEFCRKLSELRWLLAAEGRSSINVDEINVRVKFQVIENEDDAFSIRDDTVEFHLFPSRKLKNVADYVKFLLLCQKSKCEKCFIIDEIDQIVSETSTWIDPIGLIYSMFPPESILTLSSHPASRQFELQRKKDRRIVETIKMEWVNDRMKFKE